MSGLICRTGRKPSQYWVAASAAATILIAAGGGVAAAPVAHAATQLSLCSNAASPPGPVRHVMVVMLENQPYTNVIGPGSKAPYENGYLASHCGLATNMYGATHTSAANYLALTGGQFPASSPPGCGSVSACASSAASLFSQVDTAGLGWASYEESMATPCDKHTASPYKIGHNPALFYPLSDCTADDLPDPSLTAASGPLWAALTGRTLPAFTFVTPNLKNDGEGSGGLGAADSWLQAFLTLVATTATYQDGTLAILVTYDEGTGSDYAVGENCADRSADLAGKQPSCHIAAFVVYPWAAGTDSTFFTHYSITRTTDDLFKMPELFNAASANTLVGHFGL